jgi:hypothetical protein
LKSLLDAKEYNEHGFRITKDEGAKNIVIKQTVLGKRSSRDSAQASQVSTKRQKTT